MLTGTLYIVATPIGNLGDITLRAIETLKKVGLIISEDTRETSKILRKLEMQKAQISYRDQNHEKVVEHIIANLNIGLDVALVSDSGTPLISDPGYKLVRDLIQKGINVQSIPGPSSVISALVTSGLPTDKFTFLGFLPKSENQRHEILIAYGALDSTLTIFESPYRVLKLLEDVKKALGERQISLVNEQTKLHEKTYRGTTQSLIDSLKDKKLKGEFVVLIAKEGI